MHRLFVFLILSLSLGCVERGRPTRLHEHVQSPINKEPVGQNANQLNVSGDPLTQETSLQVDEALLHKLATELLRADVIRSARQRGNVLVERKLWRLNEEMAKFLKTKSTKPALQRWVVTYEELLMEGCNATLDRCLNIDFFSLSKNTATVSMLLADLHLADLPRYYNLLLMAYALKGRIYDAALADRMLHSAQPYLELLNAQNPRRALEFAQIITTILQQVADRRDKSEMQKWSEKLNLADAQNRQRLKTLGVNTNTLVQILAQNNGPQPHDLSKYFAQEKSVKSVQEELIKNHKGMLQLLGVELIQDWNESLLILDQAFMGILTSDQALILLQAQKKSRVALATQIRQIYLIRFVETLRDSSRKAHDYFFAEKVTGDEMLLHAVRSGSRVQPIWGVLNARVSNFQRLSLRLLRQHGEVDSIFNDIEVMFEGAQKNIKFMGVYPQMMALTYYMSKLNAKHTIAWGFRNFDLDSSYLIEKLFFGEFEPWFEYSTDMKPLNFIEMLYAFDFALRTQIFAQFKIDPAEFMAVISERLMRKSTARLRDYSLMLKQRMQSDEFSQFRKFCHEMDLTTVQLPMDLTYITSSPLLGRLGSFIFSDISNKEVDKSRTNKSGISLKGFMIFDDQFATAAEVARSDLVHVQNWLEAFRATYENYLKQSGEGNVDEKLKPLQASINELKNIRSQFFKSAISNFRQFDSCYTKALRAEESVKIEILRREEAYLRQIHQGLVRMKSGQITADALTAQHGFKNLPQNFSGLNRFTADGFVYTKLDFSIRSLLYLKENNILNGKTWPAIAPQMWVNFGKILNADHEAFRHTKSVLLTYTPDEEAFVAQGLYTLLNKAAETTSDIGYTTWNTSLGSRTLMWSTRLHAATILYRFYDAEVMKDLCQVPQLCHSNRDLISAEEVLRIHEDMLSLTRIEGEERRFMQMTGLFKKLYPTNLNRKILDYNLENYAIVQVWGLYDLPSLLITRPVLGATHLAQESTRFSSRAERSTALAATKESARHFGFDRLGSLYWQARQSQGRKSFLIPVSEEVDQSLDQSVRSFIHSEIDKVQSFGRQLILRTKEISTWPLDSRPRADISTIESIREPLLRSDYLRNFDFNLVTFHSKTDNCFVQNACPSFSQSK